jgi:hypothetical protein
MRFCLTCAICGCIIVTYGPRKRGRESRAAKSCSRPAAPDRSTARGCRAIGARLFHFFPTSLSIPAARTKAERAGSRERAKAGVHSQASAQPDSAGAVIRICQKDLHQRSREPGVIGAPAARRRSWLSRGESRHERFGLNINLTVWRLKNWLRLIRYWYPIGGERLERHPPNQSILIRR